MFSKTVRVGSKTGLHVRPAAVISEAASSYDDEITVTLAGESDGVDAASSLMLMTLGAEAGADVVVSSDNEAAVAEIAALIEKDLDE